MKRRDKKAIPKLNLIPILDSIFIFIFFLLMSAQFVDIVQIGSNVPSISESFPEKPDRRKPLNLILEINKKSLILKTGLEEKVNKTFLLKGDDFDYQSLYQSLVLIKKKNWKENSIILRPTDVIPFKKIIKIMDTVRFLNNKDSSLFQVTNRNKDLRGRELFNIMAFENI